jgi:hypothetical protein
MPYIPILKAASTSIGLALGVYKADKPTFTFIRHPLDRLCSAVAWETRDSKENFYLCLYRMIREQNPHVRPQAEIIDQWKDRLEFIGQVEHFDRDWAWVQERLPVGWPGHERRSKNKKDYRTVNWKGVEHLYKKDFDLCPEYELLDADSTIPEPIPLAR